MKVTLIKDIDFSPAGIRERWQAGYADTMRALEMQAWLGESDPLEGVILHEPQPGAEPAAEVDLDKAGNQSEDRPHNLAAE